MTISRLFIMLVALAACRQTELPAPCDSLTLAQLQLECRAKVRAECARTDKGVDPSCPTLLACDKEIDQWHACTGAGGASDGGSK